MVLVARRIALLGCGALVLAAFSSAGPGHTQELAPRLRLVAQPGDALDPLVIGGETVHPDPQRDRLSIDRDGHVIFTGTVDPPRGTTFVQGIFIEDHDGLGSVAVPGDTVPQAGGIAVSGYEVFEIEHARRSPDGDTLVQARIAKDGFIYDAYLTEISGTPRTSATETLAIPGLCDLSRLGHASVARSYALHGGTLVFHGKYDKDVCPTGDELLFIRNPDADAFEFLRSGGTVPGPPDFEAWAFRGPQVGEDGAILTFATCTTGQDPFDALLLAEPTESPKIVARTGVAIPGTSDGIVALQHWQLAPAIQSGAGTRVAYVATSSPTGEWNTQDEIHVFDLSHGTDPILSTGDTLGGYTFTAAPFQPYSIQPADHGQVVVVGKTTGPDVAGGEADGVWRFDPRTPPHLELVLYEGGPVPGPGNDGLTISQIFTVNVDRHGQIAAEIQLSGPGDAILLEERDPTEPGRFQVALKKGDQVPTRTGTTEVVGINRTYPNDAVSTGPGLGGLQTRFNERGEFVFQVRADFGGSLGRGVYVVTIEEPPEECVLQASVKGRNLRITGGKCSCNVTVESDGSGTFRVIPGEDTTVNGMDQIWVGSATGSVTISMGAGDDTVVLRSLVPADSLPPVTDVPRNLVFDGGPGVDRLFMDELRVGRSLTVRTGSGDADMVTISNTEVTKSFQLTGGDGLDEFELDSLTVGGKTSIRNGAAWNSKLAVMFCKLGKTKITGGAEGDVIGLEECDVGHNLTIGTAKTGTDVTIDGGRYARKVTVKTRGSGAGKTNGIDVMRGDFDRSLVVRGKGSHRIHVEDCVVPEGIAINLKKGTKDFVEVMDSEVGKGLLQVRSRAAAFEGEFLRNTVADGALYVRSGKGSDKVTIGACSATRSVQVILSAGDDELHVDGTTATGDMRLGGGPGDDRLYWEHHEPNTVGGVLKKDSFTEVPHP